MSTQRNALSQASAGAYYINPATLLLCPEEKSSNYGNQEPGHSLDKDTNELRQRARMAERPVWEQVGTSFVHLYYQRFDTTRVELSALYTDASCLSWEGQQFQGKTAIMEKLMSLPFQKIQHSITSQDHQPAPDNCILSMVVGQLKVDNDPVMGFHQLFVLKNINDNWVCTNDVFRLALYNFA